MGSSVIDFYNCYATEKNKLLSFKSDQSIKARLLGKSKLNEKQKKTSQ